MNKISGETKTIFNLLGEEGRGFLVPEYQRQYSWTERECERLWDDLWDFAFPRGNPDEYIEDKGRPYFLGSVVMFVNEADDGEYLINCCGFEMLKKTVKPNHRKGNVNTGYVLIPEEYLTDSVLIIPL